MRKIVTMRPREWLRESALGQLTESAMRDRVANEAGARGARLARGSQAVVLPTRLTNRGDIARVVLERSTGLPHGYVVPMEFDDDSAEAAFVADNPELVEAVYSDPPIAPFAIVCPASAVGVPADVLTATNVGPVHAAGHKGTGTRLIIVDTGIDGSIVNVSGGWNLYPGVAPGMAAPNHGTMVAWDAQLMAPNAAIWDCPLLQSSAGTFVAYLSDAIRAYGQILATVLQTPGVWIAVNSWGMYDRAYDAPVGSPQNYARNPRHPFNQIIGATVGSGVDVVFAAGNCGATCPSGACGLGDIGPGQSIHGANSHPDAISVAAATHVGDRLGYSSQGPGGLSAAVPDLAAPSHFDGAGIVYPIHTGTSAACPIVAGAIAAARSKSAKARALPAAQLKAHLLATARQPAGVAAGWNADYGHGMIDAGALWALL